MCHEIAYETPSGTTCENQGHGGAPVLDELPACRSCGATLAPEVKFCAECGTTVVEDEAASGESSEPTCPKCGEPVDPAAKFCGECGARIGEVSAPEPETDAKQEPKSDVDSKGKIRVPVLKADPKPEKTVRKPKPEPEEPEKDEGEPEVDFSKIDPKDWECFGQIEPDHVECKPCPYREKCAEKAGVEL